MVSILSLFGSASNLPLLALLIVGILIVEVFLFSFPKEIVMLFAGFTYGFILGGFLNLIGLVGALWLGYEAGLSGRFGVEKYRHKPVLQKYERWLQEKGMKSLLFLRLFPLTPNDILSIASGFAKLERRRYLFISIITAIPYAFLWSYLGANSMEKMQEIFDDVFDPITWIITLLIIILIGYIMVLYGSEDTD